MTENSLPASKLGTKSHWDQVYTRECDLFKETGDEGEIWFGEDVAESMLDWTINYLPPSFSPKILDLGTGNGHLLRLFVENGYEKDDMLGMDYSAAAVELAKQVNEREGVKVQVVEGDILIACEQEWTEKGSKRWDLVTDKGTFDAICLMEKQEGKEAPEKVYVKQLVDLLNPGGFFLITSCNWTTNELRSKFEPSLKFHSEVGGQSSFMFGGISGQTTSTVAFTRRFEGVDTPMASRTILATDQDDTLFIPAS